MVNIDTIEERDFQVVSIGFIITSSISSITGSPVLIIRQSLLTSSMLSPSTLLVVAQIIILFIKHLLKRNTLPVTDCNMNQIVQIPIDELQDLINRLIARNPERNLQTDIQPNQTARVYTPTPLPPEAPMVISLYIAADFSKETYSPAVFIFVPFISFRGLHGAIPIIILALIMTIIIRCIVPPETTGAKPLNASSKVNQGINLNPEELLEIMKRYGRYFINH